RATSTAARVGDVVSRANPEPGTRLPRVRCWRPDGATKIVAQMSGWSRPDAAQLMTLVRERKANEFRFADDGFIPNHPRWPLIVYHGAVNLPDGFDPAAVFEDLFERHGWGDSWRNGVFDYPHYHSRIHEVLGIGRGGADIRFGGERGRT